MDAWMEITVCVLGLSLGAAAIGLWFAANKYKARAEKLSRRIEEERQRGKFNRDVSNGQLTILLKENLSQRKQLLKLGIRS